MRCGLSVNSYRLARPGKSLLGLCAYAECSTLQPTRVTTLPTAAQASPDAQAAYAAALQNVKEQRTAASAQAEGGQQQDQQQAGLPPGVKVCACQGQHGPAVKKRVHFPRAASRRISSKRDSRQASQCVPFTCQGRKGCCRQRHRGASDRCRRVFLRSSAPPACISWGGGGCLGGRPSGHNSQSKVTRVAS